MRIFGYDESVNIRQHLLAISCIFNCMCTAARTFIGGRRLHTVALVFQSAHASAIGSCYCTVVSEDYCIQLCD